MAGLARAFLVQLLAADPKLLKRYRAALPDQRTRGDRALQALAERLWNPLNRAGTLRDFVQQIAHSSDESQFFGRLAGALLPIVHADLSDQLLLALRTPSAMLQISVNLTNYACARYLTSLIRVWPVPGNYFALPTDPWVKTEASVEVAWQPIQEFQQITALQHELRAKTLMMLTALAATAEAEGRSGETLFVGLSDLMGYLGYKAGKKANARYYWFHTAEVVRALLHDLPGHQVRVDGRPAQPLLIPPQVVFRNPHQVVQLASLTPERLREADILGFYVRFEPAMLGLLGINQAHKQTVPLAFCHLHGPCFWMAWRVAYWQYWGHHQTCDLLRFLEECGYLATHCRSGRTRYKDALKDWWRDVGRLVDIELLSEPGVRLYQGNKEVSDKWSQLIEEPRSRLGVNQLEQLKAQFTTDNSRTR
ncbi:MAG: hypothetical protein SFU83_22975 [Meiothermus sp.]|nr:hypothetical protein [Meiothermus sp.]